MNGRGWVVLVEGKHDVSRVREVDDRLSVYATHGWPSATRIHQLGRLVGDRSVAILTDSDSAGRRIRKILHDAFPLAVDVYVRRSSGGVEHTAGSDLFRILVRAGILEEDVEDAARQYRVDGNGEEPNG